MQTYSLPQTNPDSVVLLQITDTHLFANDSGALLGVVTKDSFHAVLDGVDAAAPVFDAIVATGDISQDHTPESYQIFADGISRWSQPCFWLAGNHDYPPSMTSVYPSNTIKSCEQVLVGKYWQIILLDSQIFGVPHGELSVEQLDLLDHSLAMHPDRYTLVMLHHHPVKAGSAWLDQHRLHDSEKLWQVLGRYNQVKAILCGHIHQNLDRMYQGVRVLATPSTCIQFLPNSDEFALDRVNPGWRYLTLTKDGEIITEVHRLQGEQFKPDFDTKGY